MAAISGVLLDSGDVLMRPAGGRWWPKPGFGPLVAAAGLPPPRPAELEEALAAGMELLVAEHHVTSLDAEVDLFGRYYTVVLGRLYPAWPGGLAARLAADAVATPDQAPFPDAAPVLERLRRRGVRVGVVSNAWPSLRHRYAAAGLDVLLDAFVISAELGVPKPEPAIYLKALGDLGVRPGAVLFVDDDPAGVDAAVRLGMRGAVMDRYGGAGHVADLAAVEALAAGT